MEETFTIGRYEVIEQLGQGGMAKVYLAEDPYMKRQVAIKLLPIQFMMDDPILLDYFKQEAEVVANLEHPTVAPVFDYGYHTNGQPYLVMRYMMGGTLEEMLADGKLRVNKFARIMQRVADALDYAHDHGVIHRDIKPSNILFDQDGQAYLGDFGLAKFYNRSSGQTGTLFLGTPEYMSPEQVKNDPHLDGRCDIYSLGIILFRYLAGKLPYQNDSPMATAIMHVLDPLPNILEIKPDLNEHWAEVLAKATAKDPNDRYNRAHDLAEDIRAMSTGRWYLQRLGD
ncbi:MAG TPA: serine/threonine-protein kinase [Anaerolineae bacterium]|nr:serine/threonine-protein kinase [Anaerolineae bacterium]